MTKVLMLGWEFPPLFSGGLGIATYGIVKALSQKVSIQLIIPTSGEINNISNVWITGLNRLTAKEIDLEKLQFSLSFPNTEVYTVPITVSPYHHINQEIAKNNLDELIRHAERKGTLNLIHEIFSGSEVYGGDVMHKVFLFARLAEELASDRDFNVIHAHDWITFPAALNIKERAGKPLILHVHALETDRAGQTVRNEIYNLEKKSFDKADKIFAVSQFTKNQIVQHYQILPEKIAVVHNGIDPLKTQRKEHILKDKLVVFLGRITNQKGPQFLLETAEKVLRVYPRVKFVVAGTGDQFAHLLETSAYKKLGRKFIFTGFLSKAKVNELFSMAEVYFMPSVSEPFGLTVLEAAQHEVPTVISSQSGASEVLKSSLKADFWDTDKYANYIFALLKYKALGKTLTEEAKRELETLTWEQTAEKIHRVYQELAKYKVPKTKNPNT